ncbi:hypothetical protein [Roseateles sp. P5_E4]
MDKLEQFLASRRRTVATLSEIAEAQGPQRTKIHQTFAADKRATDASPECSPLARLARRDFQDTRADDRVTLRKLATR